VTTLKAALKRISFLSKNWKNNLKLQAQALTPPSQTLFQPSNIGIAIRISVK